MPSNVLLILIYTCLTRAVFNIPIFVLYYQNQLGLTFADLMIAQAFVALTIIIMEVPSGWLSDIWSRRGTVMLGCCVGILGYAVLLIAPNLIVAAAGQMCIGIAMALSSGTLSSIIYDTLAAQGDTTPFHRYESYRHATNLLSTAGASIIGAYIYTMNPYWPLGLDAITMGLALIALFFMTEPPRTRDDIVQNPLHDMAVTIRDKIWINKDIRQLMLFGGMILCTLQLFFWLLQPYMIFTHIPVDYFGWIIAIGYLSGGLGSLASPHILKNTPYHTAFGGMIISLSICALIPMIWGHAWAMGLLLFTTLMGGMVTPYIQTQLHHRLDSTRRATVLSSLGLITSLFFIPLSIIMGWIGDAYGAQGMLGFIIIQMIGLSTMMILKLNN